TFPQKTGATAQTLPSCEILSRNPMRRARDGMSTGTKPRGRNRTRCFQTAFLHADIGSPPKNKRLQFTSGKPMCYDHLRNLHLVSDPIGTKHGVRMLSTALARSVDDRNEVAPGHFQGSCQIDKVIELSVKTNAHG